MYFNKFPVIAYDFLNASTNKKEYIAVKDITTNIRIRKDILTSITLYDEYDIVDGDTPEIIAAKVYGNPQYHWIIMLTNERFDFVNDFPLPQNELVLVLEDRYGEDLYEVRHYVDPDTGFVVPQATPGRVAVTNYEYELVENERKRRIKIISPTYIPSILSQFDMRV